jgi:hypothetical protein
MGKGITYQNQACTRFLPHLTHPLFSKWTLQRNLKFTALKFASIFAPLRFHGWGHYVSKLGLCSVLASPHTPLFSQCPHSQALPYKNQPLLDDVLNFAKFLLNPPPKFQRLYKKIWKGGLMVLNVPHPWILHSLLCNPHRK